MSNIYEIPCAPQNFPITAVSFVSAAKLLVPFNMAIRVVEFSNGVHKIRKIFAFKNSYFCKLLSLPISPILKIQTFLLGMLILRQKSF